MAALPGWANLLTIVGAAAVVLYVAACLVRAASGSDQVAPRPRALATLGALLGACLVLTCLPGGLGNMILTNSLITLICFTTIVLLGRCGEKPQQPAGGSESLLAAAAASDGSGGGGGGGGGGSAQPAARRPRAVYLDNLKVLLTAIVVNHHCFLALGGAGGWFAKLACYTTSFSLLSGWISGLNQCYFMALFFFISGLFTPGSFDKHVRQGTGIRGFLRDKCLRAPAQPIPFLHSR